MKGQISITQQTHFGIKTFSTQRNKHVVQTNENSHELPERAAGAEIKNENYLIPQKCIA